MARELYESPRILRSLGSDVGVNCCTCSTVVGVVDGVLPRFSSWDLDPGESPPFRSSLYQPLGSRELCGGSGRCSAISTPSLDSDLVGSADRTGTGSSLRS
jgi:hypothetical protein